MSTHNKPIYIQDDVLDDLGQDNFGHRYIAEAVVDSILHTKPPFIIGIFGGWGTGKSSLLEIIKTKLPNNKIASVTIDAWRYTSTQNLRRAFLIHVAKELAPEYLNELRARLYTSEQNTVPKSKTDFGIKKRPNLLSHIWELFITAIKIIGVFVILSILFLILLFIIFSIMIFIKYQFQIPIEIFFMIFDWQAWLNKYLDLAFIPLLLVERQR